MVRSLVLVALWPVAALAQVAPYDVFPAAEPPYFRVRYEAKATGNLIFPVNYTIWIPPGVKSLRGVVVHQHGCGTGSCKSGLTGAFDLHWKALAKKHDCALLAPAYEQPEKADCQMWCDPRNGSDVAFRKCLEDLGRKCGHPELSRVPWAIWGHSGGGHWCGGMVMLHPERIVAAWLRSGVPLLENDPKRSGIKSHSLPDAALNVPMMCNLGTKEGVSEKTGQFAGVWPANQAFFHAVRGKGGLIGIAIDPLSSHDCGHSRYLAIPWLDACLSARLPAKNDDPLKPMPAGGAILATIEGKSPAPADRFTGDVRSSVWLPNEQIAKSWSQYIADTKVGDATPPPAPTNVKLSGATLTWECEADLESGLSKFIIERDGRPLAELPEKVAASKSFRPLFQGQQYSDTPTMPLAVMKFVDPKPEPGQAHVYRVKSVNTLGLQSVASDAAK